MRYKSCNWLEHGISIENNTLHSCCVLREAYKGKPLITNWLDNEKINWDEVFRIKRLQRLEQQKNGFSQCEGCSSLYENDWDDEDYILHINFNHWKNCNSDCVYCNVHDNKSRPNKSVLESISELMKIGKFRNYGEITFQGGEPTLLPEFEKLLDLFINNCHNIRVHSSGILFNQTLKKGIEAASATVIISPDSGLSKTYKKIKRVNKSDNVWKNIKRYREGLNDELAFRVKVKYIITPGINDNLKEINAFIMQIKNCDIRSIIIDIESCYANINSYNISPHIYMLLDYFEKYANENNIEFELYDTAKTALKYRDVVSFFDLDEKSFKRYFLEYKKKDKTQKKDYALSLSQKIFKALSDRIHKRT